MIKIFLPFIPPSVNSCFGTDFMTKRRYKTRKYLDFIANCAVYLRGEKQIKGPIEMEINCFYPDLRIRDIDNIAKTMIDTIVYYGLIEGDHLIQRLILEKHKGPKETRILIKSFNPNCPVLTDRASKGHIEKPETSKS